MNRLGGAGLSRRQAVLAAVALLAALGAIAFTRIGGGADGTPPPPTAVVRWESARVGIFEPAPEPTGCGVTVTAQTRGVAHPVLPCGAKLVVEHHGRQTRAEVIEERPVAAGRAFELSPGLAQALGIAGEAAVRWRFAE